MLACVAAEEDVAGGLHDLLPGDHTPALVAVGARPGVRLEHGGLGLLGLQEQRVAAVAAEEQDDPRARTDTSHPDDLAGHLHQVELVDQQPTVRLEGAAIALEDLAERGVQVQGRLLREERFDRHQHGWVADDATLAVDHLGQLAQRLHGVAGPGLLDVRLGLAALLRGQVPAPLLQPRLDVEAGVEDVQIAAVGEASHRVSVRRHPRHADPAALLAAEAPVAARDGQAGHQPLDVPLPRTGQRLVEVVDVEDHSPFRRGVHAEVRQVGVTAQLGAQARHRCPGQVGCHDQGRATVEREGGDQHPSIAKGHQVRHPAHRLALEQCHGVEPVCRRRVLRVQLQGDPLAGRLAEGRTLGGCQDLGLSGPALRCSHGSSVPLRRR